MPQGQARVKVMDFCETFCHSLIYKLVWNWLVFQRIGVVQFRPYYCRYWPKVKVTIVQNFCSTCMFLFCCFNQGWIDRRVTNLHSKVMLVQLRFCRQWCHGYGKMMWAYAKLCLDHVSFFQNQTESSQVLKLLRQNLMYRLKDVQEKVPIMGVTSK